MLTLVSARTIYLYLAKVMWRNTGIALSILNKEGSVLNKEIAIIDPCLEMKLYRPMLATVVLG